MRVTKIAKYLKLNNYDVNIITSKNRNYGNVKDNTTQIKNINVIEAICFDVILLKKILKINNNSYKSEISTKTCNSKICYKFISKLIYNIMPIGNITWYWNIKNKISKLNLGESDILISTYSPFTSHLIARYLKSKFKCKWIADFRDLYAYNNYITSNKVLNILRNINQHMILKNCDFVTTVSEPLAQELSKQFNNKKKVKAITNGYDDDDFNIEPYNYDKFTITYTGSIYNGLRNPKTFFIAIKQLIDEEKIDKSMLQINYLGKEGVLFTKIAQECHIDYSINNKGFCNRYESIKEQLSSNLLLLLGFNSLKDEGVYTGKVFEYIGSKKPIIFIGNKNNGLKEILEKNNIGKCYFYSDIEGIKSYILKNYNLYIKKEKVELHGCSEFSYNEIVKKLINIIE